MEIYRQGDHFSGKIVALKEPLTEDGKLKADLYPPDVRWRQDPLIGLKPAWGFTY